MQNKVQKIVVRKGSPFLRGIVFATAIISVAGNYAQWSGIISNPAALAYIVQAGPGAAQATASLAPTARIDCANPRENEVEICADNELLNAVLAQTQGGKDAKR